jgi:ATP-binding cassette subfamily B protein
MAQGQPMPTPTPFDERPALGRGPRRALEALRSGIRAFQLVWQQHPRLALALVGLSLATGGLPGCIAYLTKLIVDAVSAALRSPGASERHAALVLLALELGAVVLLLALQRALSVCDALLRVRLSQGILEQVLRRALDLELSDLENAQFHDELRVVTEQASERPLALVRRSLIALQQSATLVGLLIVLAGLSGWLLGLLAAATLPALWVELRLNADAFRLFRSHAPEARRQRYLETLLTSEAHAKELKSYGVGPALLKRHRGIFERFYHEDRRLSVRRALWGFGFSLISALALSACYLWVTWRALTGGASIGTLAMLFLVLRQAQASISDLVSVLAGMHEDQQYVTALDEFLARSPRSQPGTAKQGPLPGSGIRLENVSFTYPGSTTPALRDITLHLPANGHVSILGKNGAGKTTLLKLLIGLYRPTSGLVTLDGLSLEAWDPERLRARLAVMFQDFNHYQLLAGENVGIGSASSLDDRARWREAARAALLDQLLESLPAGYETQLGQWFEGGRELSTGEWQRVALARLFTKPDADIVVLDEPTASIDKQAEALLLNELTRKTRGRLAILISHRATWSAPDGLVAVLEAGRLVEFRNQRDAQRDSPLQTTCIERH